MFRTVFALFVVLVTFATQAQMHDETMLVYSPQDGYVLDESAYGPPATSPVYNYTLVVADYPEYATPGKKVKPLLQFFDTPVECALAAKKGEAMSFIPQHLGGAKVHLFERPGCILSITWSGQKKWVFMEAGTYYPADMIAFHLNGGLAKYSNDGHSATGHYQVCYTPINRKNKGKDACVLN